jgi:VWFA-related protein
VISKIQRSLLVAIVLVPLLWTAAFAQQAPPDLSIRTTTRVVLVDAIVTDAGSHPVRDLAAPDFTIFEDGKPQKISFFSLESPAQHQAALPQLRPGVFTNRPEYHNTAGPLVILLLDGLNTPPAQQSYVRQQILKYLASLRISSPGTAILALGNDLSVLQDFTTSPQLLLAAVHSYKGERTAVDVESPKIDIPVTTGPGGGMPAQANVPPPVDSGTEVAAGTAVFNSFQELADSLKRFDKAVSVDNQDARVRATLAALRTISRAVVGYPGRKALIWFSAGFPFNLALDETMDLEFSKSYRDQIRQAAALLSNANVAVYPVDARGLLTVGALADPTTPATQGPPDKSLAAATWQKFNTEDTMDRLARDTGGEVFRNANDLNGALQAAIADSEACYVLGYYPERKNWDGKFHNLKVLVRNKQLKIRARTGYFAVDPANWRKGGDEKQMISPSAVHMLASTGVLFYVHPISPQKKDEPANIEILVDANTVSFGTGPEFTYQTDLEFQVGAFAPDGKLVRLETQTAQAALRNETYQQFIKTGIPVRVPISLKPGKYLLRVAARDNRNGHIGTLDVALNLQ